MSETRKNHLTIDGGQVKEDEHISTYKTIPESDTDFRKSKSSLSKSREKVSLDGAEEKLLQKEDEVKIVPRVDMDAKYVVESYTNGDAKIELDANKRQFTGLTKEELMKYADDPFWVRLRWVMFILFWLLWLCMLAGAIVVIVQAPKCLPPTPKTWFEKGPLVESSPMSYEDLEPKLSILGSVGVQGVFTTLQDYCSETYNITATCLDELKGFITKAKENSIQVIVDVTANFVSKSHEWFKASEKRTPEYDTYFIWHKGTGTDDVSGRPGLPNNWTSTENTPAWSWSETRGEYYLHQYGEEQPDLNFNNPEVVQEFSKVIRKVMGLGAGGIRLHKARQLLVNSSFAPEEADTGRGSYPGATHADYRFWRHTQTSDQPGLKSLLGNWSQLVDQSGSNSGAGETVFTLAEDGIPGAEMFFVKEKLPPLRPISARPLQVTGLDVAAVAEQINQRLNWTALQLKGPKEASEELSAFAMVLPAAPVLEMEQILHGENDTLPSDVLKHLSVLRSNPTIEHGEYNITAVPAPDNVTQVLACARWKSKHIGFVALFNPLGAAASANLTAFPITLPETLTVYYVSEGVKNATNYTLNHSIDRNSVLVPSLSSVVLSYAEVEKE